MIAVGFPITNKGLVIVNSNFQPFFPMIGKPNVRFFEFALDSASIPKGIPIYKSLIQSVIEVDVTIGINI